MRAMTVAVRARRVVGAVLLLAPMSGATQEAREAEVRQAMARAYVAQRADESGSIPPGSMFRAWQEVTALPSANFAFADPAWRPVGPAGLYLAQGSFGGVFAGELKAGRVNTIAVHPTDGRTILIGSQGGIWRTTNGGHTWTPTSDGQCSSSIGAIAFDPVNPNLVYAATGDGRGAVQLGCGVIRSFDGGQTWTAPANTSMVDTWPLQLVIDRASAGSTTGSTLYVASIQGLYVSNNSGATWTRRLTGLVSSVVAHPTRPGVLFASAYRSGNVPASTVLRSADGGFTWAPMATPLASISVAARMTLVISPASPDRLVALAASYNNRRLLGVYRWDEVSQTWATLPTVGLVTTQNAYPFTWGEQGEYNQVLAIDPRDAARMWVAGVGAFASQDGGQSFQVAARNVHVDWHALALDPTDPDHLVAGTDGGVYQSFDGGRTWRSFNAGLAIAQIYPGLSVHPSGHWLYAGLQDNNAVYSTGSTIWNNLSYLGDGGYTAVNPNDPGTVYVTHAFLNFITRRATGSAEASRTTGIINGDRSGVPRPIVLDPVVPSTLYFGTQRLYRSVDEGLFWSPISIDLTRGSGFITSIAVAPSNRSVIWIATSDGVIAVTFDGGLTYTRFVFGTSRNFTKIIVDPADPTHAIATASTVGAPRATETRDGGTSFFTTIGTNLPNVPVHTILPIPGTSTLMAGTDYGVLLTTNGGTSWTQGPPGLPTTIVHDLAWAPASGTVFASTFGRGAFAIRPGNTVAVRRGDVDGDGQLTAQDALTIQLAVVGVHPQPGRTLYPNGDANCDGVLSSVDAMLVLRTAAGLATTGTCAGTLARTAVASNAGLDQTTRTVVRGLAGGR